MDPMDGGVWWAAGHGSLSQTWLSNFTFTFHFPALEKEITTHSSVLAWRIPGKAEPGGLLSVGSHRVGHDWSYLSAAAAAAAAVVKNPPAHAGDTRVSDWIPGSWRSPREGNSNLLKYSYQGNPMDRGA